MLGFNMLGRAFRSLAAYALKDPALAKLLSANWMSDAGIPVTAHKVIGYAPFWRGMNLIAGDVASLPIDVYRRNGEERERYTTHPARLLLRWRANSEVTAHNFRKAMTAHALLRGNAYAWVERRNDGAPIALWPMKPDDIRMIREADESTGRSRLWYVNFAHAQPRKLAHDDVLHIRGLGDDGIVGYDLLHYHQDTIATGLAARQYGATYFRNNARPNVVLKRVGANLTPEQEKALRSQWEEMQQGLSNAHKTAVLPMGMDISVLDTAQAKNVQLLELRQHEVREVANLLGVPPHKLGDNSRTAYNSLEQENQSYLSDCLNPWLVQWETECNQKLLTEREQVDDTAYVEFTREALVRVDHKTSVDTTVTQVNNGLLTVNEARRMRNLPAMDGGDVPRRPANIVLGSANDTPPEGSQNEAQPPNEDDIAAARQNVAQVLRAMWGRVAQHVRKACRAADAEGFAAAVAAIDAQHAAAFRNKVGAAHAVSAALVGGWEFERLADEFFGCVQAGLGTLGAQPDDAALTAWEETGDSVIERILADAIGG